LSQALGIEDDLSSASDSDFVIALKKGYFAALMSQRSFQASKNGYVTNKVR
jgi:hypothetical protein